MSRSSDLNVVGQHVVQRLSVAIPIILSAYFLSAIAYKDGYNQASKKYDLENADAKNSAASPAQELVYGAILVACIPLEAIVRAALPYMSSKCCKKGMGDTTPLLPKDNDITINTNAEMYCSKTPTVYIPKAFIFLAMSAGVLAMSAVQVWPFFDYTFSASAPSNAEATLGDISIYFPPVIMLLQTMQYLTMHHLLFSSYKNLPAKTSDTTGCARMFNKVDLALQSLLIPRAEAAAVAPGATT